MLLIFGRLQDLADMDLVKLEDDESALTLKGVSQYDQIKAEGFIPLVEYFNDTCEYLQIDGDLKVLLAMSIYEEERFLKLVDEAEEIE